MNRTVKMILAAATATAMFGATAYAGNPHGNHHRNDRDDGLALAAGIVNLVRTVIDPVGTAIFPTPGCVTVHPEPRRAPAPPRHVEPPRREERKPAPRDRRNDRHNDRPAPRGHRR